MPSFPQPRINPSMGPDTVLQGDRWRIGVITESLIRLEWQDDGVFEDHATQMVANRNWDVTPQFTHTVRNELLIVDTPTLRLTYDMQPFSKEGLSIVVKGVANSQMNTWHYGDAQDGNLHGTARTLDTVDGATQLEPGILSRDGWAVIDDSSSNIITDADAINGEANPFGVWVTPRTNPETDLYFFGYGNQYIEAIQDFYRLTGPTPLLPRFALGNWWSRYHRYTEQEYLALIDRFEHEKLPFTTAVIDMDWHLVDDVDPQYGSGWTGYTWNRELFPDPERFLRSLHEHGLKTTLNVHPRDGIRAFENGYERAALHMGIDPASGEPVEFDVTSPRFMETYFDLHHKLEDEGVDFWWLDWQQGGVTRQQGLDPLWMLNHMHYLDSGRNGRWPLTFSRYAGPGSHRYPVGFSGDTVVTWESLQFQPYFTATASNIGYGWWSHDIGGHMFGYRDEELEARWYQLGTFSPINRLHSTDSPFNGKEPWNFHAEIRHAMNAALRLRHEMLPYLYTMNWRASAAGRPLVEPMYWQDPNNAMAYEIGHEFRFGTELVVSPVTSPIDRDVQLAKTDVWLPQGTWFDFFTGRRYESKYKSGRSFEAWRDLHGIPVFAKAGGIVPMQPLDANGLNSTSNPSHVMVMVFPGADGAFTVKEDDGTNQALPDDSKAASTTLTLGWGPNGTNSADAAAFTIAPATGNISALPVARSWCIIFRGVAPATVTVTVDDEPVTADTTYDEATLSLSVSVPLVPITASITITAANGLTYANDPALGDAFTVLYNAQINYLTKERANAMIRAYGADALNALYTLERTSGAFPRHDFEESHMPQSVIQAVAEPLLRTSGSFPDENKS